MLFARAPLLFALTLLMSAPCLNAQGISAVATVPMEDIARYRPDSAFLLLKTQLQAFQADGNMEGEAHIYRHMGQVLLRMGSYPQALAQLLEADKRYRQLKRLQWIAENNNILGTVYYYNRQSPEALQRFAESRDIYARAQDHSGLSETYAHIGRWYEKHKAPDSARYFQRMALGYARQSSNRPATARIYENLGSIYEDLGRYDSARYYYQSSLNLYRELGLRAEQAEVVNNLGDVFSKTGDFARGLAYAREASALAWMEQDKYQLQGAYRDMAEAFQALGRLDSAYVYLEKSRELVQEIYTVDNQRQVAILQTLYDVEQKNAEIGRLNADRKIYLIVLVSVLVVALLLALLGWVMNSRQKLKIRNEQRLNEQQQRIHAAEKGLMESALRMRKMEEEGLKQELEIRSKELSSHILHLIQKNEVMEDIRTGLQEIIRDDRRDQKKQIRQLLSKINFSFAQDDYWNEFRLIFDKVHASFFTSLKQHSPDLTPAEIRLLALVKMELSSADTAKLLGVTQDSLRVMRYRVKKKLGIGAEDSIQQFVAQLG